MKPIRLVQCVLLLVLVLGVIITLSNTWIEVTKTDILIPGLADELKGLRIMHLTDLHGMQFGDGQRRLLSVIDRNPVDIVAVTGDLLDDGRTAVEPIASLLAQLAARSQVYFVSGNHDHWGAHELLVRRLNEVGVAVLDNRAQAFQKGGAILWMVGIDDAFTGRDDLDNALAMSDRRQPSVLLSHTPDLFPRAANQGIALTLSGHYHGGQIRLPWIGALYAPGGEFFPKYDSGLYQQGESSMYLSRGLGYTGIFPFRFWNRPEVAVITLQ